MPAAAALPWVIGLSAAGATAGQIYSAKKGAQAARTAAQIQSEATTQAADYSRENLDKALAFERERLGWQREAYDQQTQQQREMYEQSRADAAPYRQMGQQASGALGGLMFGGRPGGGGPAVPIAPPPGAGGGVRGLMQPGRLVSMIGPNGQVKQVPAHLVAQYQAQGGQVVS